jgi:prevent-host-death family protein
VKTVTMLEFRRDAEKIIDQVRKGQRMLLTYRGKPVMRLEPMQEPAADGDDPFYALGEIGGPIGDTLSNNKMDRIVYGA